MQTEQQNPNKDIQQGIAVCSYFVFSLVRSVQLFSRVPGTAGGNFYGLFLFSGFVMQLYYYQVNVQSSNEFDAIHYGVFFGAQIAWFLFHAARRWRAWFNGIEVHSYSPGVGILQRFFPNEDGGAVALVSDLFVAFVLCVGFYLFGCPILGSWYRSMLFWLLISYAFVSASASLQMQRMDDARIESEIWAENLRQREIQRQMRRERARRR